MKLGLPHLPKLSPSKNSGEMKGNFLLNNSCTAEFKQAVFHLLRGLAVHLSVCLPSSTRLSFLEGGSTPGSSLNFQQNAGT